MQKKRSFSVLEIILAMGLFAIVVVGAVGVVTQAFSSVRLGEEETRATFLATEGIEATRTIQERDFWALVSGTYGLSASTGRWEFSDIPDTSGKYTREVVISDVYRDGSGNIIESGGTLDLYTKRAVSVVTWNFSPTRQNTVSLSTYFTYWGAPLCYWDSGSVIAALDLPGDGNGTAVSVVENKAYVTTMRNPPSSGELFIINVSNPASPSILGRLSIRDHVYDLALSGNYAYLATAKSGEELLVADISNPASPTKASSFDIPGANQANDVSVEGNYAYVVTQSVTDGPELWILDISNPLSPTLVGGFEVGTHVYGVEAENQRAYLATSHVNKELIVLDVSNPQSPLELGSYDAPLAGANGQAVDVIRAGVAYLVTRSNVGEIPEFYLLSIANPSQISLIGSYDVSGRANGVAAGIGFALLATEKGSEEFTILDLSDPKNPTKAFSADLNGAAGGVALPEEECVAYFVTADDNAEFQVVQP